MHPNNSTGKKERENAERIAADKDDRYVPPQVEKTSKLAEVTGGGMTTIDPPS